LVTVARLGYSFGFTTTIGRERSANINGVFEFAFFVGFDESLVGACIDSSRLPVLMVIEITSIVQSTRRFFRTALLHLYKGQIWSRIEITAEVDLANRFHGDQVAI
jgi:hypothetical protein